MSKLDQLVDYIINDSHINNCKFCYSSPGCPTCRCTVDGGCEMNIKASLGCLILNNEEAVAEAITRVHELDYQIRKDINNKKEG